MKDRIKDILIRFIIGVIVGNSIGFVVNIIVSLCIGDGEYLPVMPQLEAIMPNEMSAVMLQTALLGIIGAAFSEASMIFDIARIGFVKQCLIHFAITAVIYVPFVYICYFPNGKNWILIMLANIIFTYTVNWYAQYRRNCKDVHEINERIKEVRDGIDRNKQSE